MQTNLHSREIIKILLLFIVTSLTQVSAVEQISPSSLPSPAERLAAFSQARPGELIPATISFGKQLPDLQIVQVIRRYNVKPYAIHMWAHGMSGTHRVAPNLASENTIFEAREITREMKQNARRSVAARAREFVDKYPKDKVIVDKDLQRDAKDYLTFLEQDKRILDAVERQEPIIYGLEVLGSVSNLQALAKDVAIQVFEPAMLIDGKPITLPPLQPTGADVRFTLPEIEIQSADDTYERIRAKAENPAQGGN